MTLRQLLERRTALQTELKTIHSGAPDGPLPAEAQAKWDTVSADVDNLNAQIARQSVIDDLDRRATGTPLDGGAGGFDALAKQVTIMDVLRAGMGETDEGATRAREVSAELERRSGRKAKGLLFSMALSGAPPERRVFTTTNPATGPGSNLIATEVSPNLIDRLREKLVVRRLGATVLSDLVGNLSIPRLKQSATAYWVAEDAPIPLSDPATDAVGLTPKQVGGRVEISRPMLQQSSPDVVRMVENDLTQLIATAIDRAALQGGHAAEPHGLLAPGSGINNHGLGGAFLKWDDIVDAIAKVDVANALSGSLGWVSNAVTVAKLRKTPATPTDTASTFLMTDPNSLGGYPLVSTQNLVVDGTVVSGGGTLGTLLFGDWSQLIIGYWSEIDILVNPFAESAYAKGNVQVRAMATCDVAIKQPLAFSAISGIGTA
jgi:HK97 family phage major capsid protein